MTDTPTVEELKRIMIGAHSIEWLQKAIKEHEEEYGNFPEDMALKLWMIATANGIDVPEIRAAKSDQEGTPLRLRELTDKRIQEEIENNERKEGGTFSVGPVLVTSEPDSSKPTSTGNAKTEFFVQDTEGIRIKVVARGDSMSIVANARVKAGSVIRLPVVSIYAGPFQDEPDRYWKQLTIPPFGRVEHVQDMSFKDFYQDPRKDVIADGASIFLEGVLTVLDDKEETVCTACNRWINEGKEEKHKDCGEYGTRTEVSHEGTMATGAAQIYRIRVPAYISVEGVPLRTGRIRAYGVWNGKYKELRIHRPFEVLPKLTTRASESAVAAPAAAPAPAPAKAPAKPAPAAAKKKPAPAPAAAPAPEAAAPASDDVDEAGIRSAVTRLIQKKGGSCSFDEVTREVMKALGIGDETRVTDIIEDMATSGERIREHPIGVLRLTSMDAKTPTKPAPAPAPAPAAKTEDPEEEEEEDAEEEADEPEQAEPAAPASPDVIPKNIEQHFRDYIRDLGGPNRTQTVMNLAINNGLVQVSEAEIKKHGDKEAAQRERMIHYIELGIKKGFLQWEGKYRDEGGIRKPPQKVAWVAGQ